MFCFVFFFYLMKCFKEFCFVREEEENFTRSFLNLQRYKPNPSHSRYCSERTVKVRARQTIAVLPEHYFVKQHAFLLHYINSLLCSLSYCRDYSLKMCQIVGVASNHIISFVRTICFLPPVALRVSKRIN